MRCAYCHDELADAQWTCPACNTHLREWAPLRLETDPGELRIVLGAVAGRPYGFAAPRGRDELRWFE